MDLRRGPVQNAEIEHTTNHAIKLGKDTSESVCQLSSTLSVPQVKIEEESFVRFSMNILSKGRHVYKRKCSIFPGLHNVSAKPISKTSVTAKKREGTCSTSVNGRVRAMNGANDVLLSSEV